MGNYLSKVSTNPKTDGICPTNETILRAEGVSRLKQNIKSLVTQNVYSDLVIVCGNDRYPCHRAILCTRSTWFAEVTSLAKGPIKVAHGEFAHVVAAVLTYLYTLDYDQPDQSLAWGVPAEHQHYVQDEVNDEEDQTIKSSDESSATTEYEFVGEPNSNSETPASADGPISEGQDKLSIEVQTAEDDESTFSIFQDTSLQPSALVFHAQVYCAALKLGIPCLAQLANHRCFERLLSKDIDNDELLDSVSKVFRPEVLFVPEIEVGECGGFDLDGQFADIQDQVVRLVTRRFPKIKNNAKFEEAVITCPEFGRDVLRSL